MDKQDFMVIDIGAAGTVSAMHRDTFPLGFLGNQQITRASEITFQEATQNWDVCLPDEMASGWTAPSIYLTGFATYDSARKFEVLFLEHCALQSIAARSKEGTELACKLRKDYGDFDILVKHACAKGIQA